MLLGRQPWRDELQIIDRVLRTVSDITDPQEMVRVYWTEITEAMARSDGAGPREQLAFSRARPGPPQ